MLSEKVQDALNRQLNIELYSVHLYVLMSRYFDSVNLPGFANWMWVQAQEEVMRAYKFYDLINDRNGRAVVRVTEAPSSEWASPLASLEAAYQHEQKMTGFINDLVNLAVTENDRAMNSFLQWFVTDQAGQETSINEMMQRLQLMDGEESALFMLDCELRWVFTQQTATEVGAEETQESRQSYRGDQLSPLRWGDEEGLRLSLSSR